VSAPFGFNRIITLQDVKSRLSDFLGVKYVLTFSNPGGDKFVKVFSDGKTQIYENSLAFERAFFVVSTLPVEDKQEAINAVMDPKNLLNQVAVVENVDGSNFKKNWSKGKVNFKMYSENKIVIETVNGGEGFLVLTDAFYPAWRARIDGSPTEIYLTDYAFRGIIVPEGNHIIEFYIDAGI
jgi:uncharacterized membrane protein YfhO